MVVDTERMIDIAARAIHRIACNGEPWFEARTSDMRQHRAEARAALEAAP